MACFLIVTKAKSKRMDVGRSQLAAGRFLRCHNDTVCFYFVNNSVNSSTVAGFMNRSYFDRIDNYKFLSLSVLAVATISEAFIFPISAWITEGRITVLPSPQSTGSRQTTRQSRVENRQPKVSSITQKVFDTFSHLYLPV